MRSGSARVCKEELRSNGAAMHNIWLCIISKRPHHRQEKDRHRRVLAREREVFLHELDPHTSTSQRLHKSPKIVEIAGQPVHAVDDDRVPVTNELSELEQRGTMRVFA